MTTTIYSRAACLAELISNPNSFFNCPDLHGGPGPPSAELPDGGRERTAEMLGFHQNRVAGFPRPTRKKLAASRRKVRTLRTATTD
jgi:hypothetical protein